MSTSSPTGISRSSVCIWDLRSSNRATSRKHRSIDDDLSTIRRGHYQWAILGYEIHNQHWKQGFGKEAVRAALIAGFETLHYYRIEAAINLDNQASIALAQSVGMQRECIRRGFIYENEQWVDHLIYVALRRDLN